MSDRELEREYECFDLIEIDAGDDQLLVEVTELRRVR